MPYSDPNATGVLGLCDKAGHSIDHGSIHDVPFVWRAVSSTPAPSPYDKDGRTGTLLAFQPRPGVDPGQWSGDLLTASGHYASAAHPMAQSTDRDEPLSDFLTSYPTKVDGLIQLRLYLGAPGEPPYTLKYAATDIRVTGDTWAVVRGGSVACGSSNAAVSLESILPPVTPTPTASRPATASPSAAQPSPTTAPDTSSAPALVAAASSGAPTGSSEGQRTVWLMAVLVLVGGGLVLGARLLRRSRPGASSPRDEMSRL